MVALNKTYRETLTPDRSAKDSGLRFYSPEISRWLNRDPIGELGAQLVDSAFRRPRKIDGYVFVGNNAINLRDAVGLEPHICDCGAPPGFRGYYHDGVGISKGCEEVCQDALTDPSIDKSGGGGVICYGSIKCACVFAAYGITPGQCPTYDQVVRRHEEAHVADHTCSPCLGLRRPRSELSENDLHERELALRQQSIVDFDAAIPNETDPNCKAAMQAASTDLNLWVEAQESEPEPENLSNGCRL